MMKFRMAKISVTQFAILVENPPVENIQLSLSLSFKCSFEGRRIGVEAKCAFEGDEKFLVCNLFCEFDIHPDDWNMAIKDKEFVLPKNMCEVFGAQTIGTLRGVLFCKTEGTPFSSFILPSVDVAGMIADDQHFRCE